MNLFVSNLSQDVDESELISEFSAFGQVSFAVIFTNHSMAFPHDSAIVDMPAKSEAEAAIAGMNGAEMRGSAIEVVEAHPRVEE